MAFLQNIKDIYRGLRGYTDPRNIDTTPAVTDANLGIYKRPWESPNFDYVARSTDPPPTYHDNVARSTDPPPTYHEFSSAEEPDYDSVRNDLAEAATDQIKKLLDDIKDAWNQWGGEPSFDEDELRDKAIELVGPYYEEELDNLMKELEEGRIQTVEDYDYRVAQITEDARKNLATLDLRQAKTEKEFEQTLKVIGAKTEEEVAGLKNAWSDKIASETKGILQAGKGFSGTGKERIGELERRQGEGIGFATRRGALAEEQAETIKEFDLKDVQNARLATKNLKEMELGRAETVKERGLRQYGTGEDELGLYGSRRKQQLERSQETDVQNQIQALKEQKRDEQRRALQQRLQPMQQELQEKQEYRRSLYL